MFRSKTYRTKANKRRQAGLLQTSLVLGLLLQQSLSVTTILNTTVCKEFIPITFNGNTMSMSVNPVDLEETPFTATPGVLNDAEMFTSSCHALQLGTKDNVISFGTNPREINFELSYSGSFDGFDKIVLVGLFDQDNTASVSTKEDLFGGIRSYLSSPGPKGIVAYVADSKLYMLVPQSLGKFNLGSVQGSVCPTEASEVKGDAVIRRNCLMAGSESSQYFINQASYSIGTWMLIGIIFFFFFFLIASDNTVDMNNRNLQSGSLTLHPLYSLYVVGTEQFTKGSRYSQMIVGVCSLYLCGGVIYFQTQKSGAINFEGILLSSTVCGLILSWIMTYVTGCLLRRARNVDRMFLVEVQQGFSGADMKESKEKWERDSFVRYYEYYTVCGMYVIAVVAGRQVFAL